MVGNCVQKNIPEVVGTNTSVKTIKNIKKLKSKTKTAIARATGRPRSSRDLHSIANFRLYRLKGVPALKNFLIRLKINKKNKRIKRIKIPPNSTNFLQFHAKSIKNQKIQDFQNPQFHSIPHNFN